MVPGARVSLRPSSFAAPLAASLVFLLPAPARADVSSWLFLGGGASGVFRPHVSGHGDAALQIDAGLGSTPAASVVVGGLFRMQTHFGDGTDFGAFLRTATGGFARGTWGGAIDLGAIVRCWQPSPGYAGSLVLGGPWGLTLSLGAARDGDERTTVTGVLGIDLARLTVHRTSGTEWMPNPYPSPAGPPR
jgi:hypothetical protein